MSLTSRRCASRCVGTALFALLGALALTAPACSSDEAAAPGGGGAAGSTGGDAGGLCPGAGSVPSDGGADDHCESDAGPIKQEANTCPTTPSDAGEESDAAVEELPPPHLGLEADDDDCKYHVKYSVTCTTQDQNATFF